MAYTIDLTKITQFDHVEFVAKQVVEGFITGIHKSPMHGFSVEFAEHRPYNTGEPIRHIDWKLYARTDKLFIKQYEEETNLRCHLVIDNSSSMYFPKRQKYTLAQPNKIFFAVYAAAVLMQVFKSQRDAVGLSLFSDKLELHTRARGGDAHHKMIYRELEKVLQLVIIFSDMLETSSNLDELLLALGHLRHNKHEVVLFHTFDKQLEYDFAFENRLYKFVDMETGNEVKVHANNIREFYQQTVRDYFQEIKVKCGQYQIDVIPADITQGFEQILLPYLLKRSQMY